MLNMNWRDQMGKISVSAPDEVIERWKQYAKERDMSVSQFARRALEAYCMLIEKRKGQKQHRIVEPNGNWERTK